MSLDMNALKQTFLEESFEGLELMESGILEIDIDAPDPEEINSIFRAIHSIKGGAGTFGFKEIVGLTHTFENILDEIRNNERRLTSNITDTFFKAIDALKKILEAYEADEDPDHELISSITSTLQAIQDIEQVEESSSQVASENIESVLIKFKPARDILNTGNEPLRILREIASLGETEVKLLENSIPPIDADFTHVTLSWEITVTGDELDLEEIKEPFEWVEDECEILEFIVTNKAQIKTKEIPEESKNPLKKKTTSKKTVNSSIRVDTNKIDHLVNLVGELVITQSMLSRKDQNGNVITDNIEEVLVSLERQMRDLQDGIIEVRMVPISAAFNRIPRIVRDTSNALGKEINLNVLGGETEVDKTVSEKITDPLVHIIRNAVDHGIEDGQTRAERGKPIAGTIDVSAYHQGGNLIIDIRDDGGGINNAKVKQKAIEKGIISPDGVYTKKEIDELIFAAGFSTADQISDVSGRGVGMDVVRKNIHSLKGDIDLFSDEGVGSLFRIRLPLTLAILDGQLARVGDQVFIFPILSILESIQLKADHVKTVQGKPSLYGLRDEFLPIINLFDVFNIQENEVEDNKKLLVIVEHDGKKVAIKISELLNQQQVVIKNLEQNYQAIKNFSGATILGDGTVSLILDIAAIVEHNS
tara:strand:- start:154188 stop:156128 length:1941 start_codon:yes stop_codon:yes gene_type:complete